MTASALLVSPQGRLRAGWRALLFCVLLILLTGLSVGALTVLVGGSGGRPHYERQPYIASVGFVGGALLAHWVMLRLVDRAGWHYVGLAPADAAPRRVAAGFALGGLAIGVPCVALLAAGWLAITAGAAGASAPVETSLALALLVPAALAEELMMRGYLLSALADGVGRWAALLLTSVVFAALHLRNPGMTPEAIAVVTLAGFFLGAVRLATSSLYAAWAAHLAWNVVLGVVLHALVSGQAIARAGWQTLDAGPDWATGGSWGPEGGIAAAIGLVAATSLLLTRRPLDAGANVPTAHTHA